MSGDHGHSHTSAIRAGSRHKRVLFLSFLLIGGFFGVELVGGIATRSLALLSDAGHMLTDVIGLGMALAAIGFADRHERRAAERNGNRHTFGLYRLEILAALANSVLLIGVGVYVLVEAIRRLSDEAEVASTPMLVIAVVGLVVNLVAFMLLRRGAEESLNVRGAYLEVVADTVGSVGVIVAAVLMKTFGWTWADPVIGAAIGLWILPRAARLGGQAIRILLQSAPPDVDLDALEAELRAIDGVSDVHDLHVWTLTSEMDAASAHLVVTDGTDTHAVLDRARDLLGDRCGISHGTFQVEPDDHRGCAEVTW